MQTFSRWLLEQAQGKTLRSWRDATVGQKLLGDILSVVNMISMTFLLVISKIHGLESKSIDFVLAFLQADLDVDIWMDLLMGFEPIEDPDHKSQYVLKLRNNLYGLKQASFNWYKMICDEFKD
jgi:hypothetical protein